jgi:uncharacterized membrane protein YbaN (DUF454 family)
MTAGIGPASAARRALFAALGVLSVALALVGVFVPGLPTTVFVIAASYLFARSSPELDAWLRGNRWFGPALRRFTETGGMPLRSKVAALASMWAGLSIGWMALADAGLVIRLIVLSLGAAGTVAIVFYVRTTAAVVRT